MGDAPKSPMDSGYASGNARSRRTGQSSSGESEPHISVVSTRFRAAYPDLRRRPLVVDPRLPDPGILTKFRPDFQEISDAVLRHHGLLQSESGRCAEAYMKGQPDRPETFEPTVTIILPWSSESKWKWPQAIHDIVETFRSLLQNTEFDPPRIEMMAPELLGPIYFGPVHNRPDLVQAWDEIKRTVHERLDLFDATRGKMTTVALFRYGLKAVENNPPTVYISVNDTSDESQWHSILTNIESTFAEKGWRDVRVHMEHNEPESYGFQRLNPKNEDGKAATKAIEGNFIIESDYRDKVNMGDDIGAGRYLTAHDGTLTNPSYGTLGCYLEICTKSQPAWKMVALTNYHVVRPAFEGFQLVEKDGKLRAGPPAPGSHLSEVDLTGWALGSKVQKPAGMESPSRIKHNFTIWKLEQQIEAAKARIQQYGEKEEIEELENYQNEFATKADFFNKNRQGNIQIIAASGYKRRSDHNQRLDWALIGVDDERQGSNRLPDRQTWIQSYMFPSIRPEPDAYGALLKAQRSSILWNNSILSYRPKTPSIWKLGARSGLTAGEFSEMKPDVDLDEEAHVGQGVSNEYVYVYKQTKKDHTPFSAPGDSGSVVFDGNGAIVGLLFRGQVPKEAEAGSGFAYVTPIEYVFADIKKIYNGHITHVRVAEGQ